MLAEDRESRLSRKYDEINKEENGFWPVINLHEAKVVRIFCKFPNFIFIAYIFLTLVEKFFIIF